MLPVLNQTCVPQHFIF